MLEKNLYLMFDVESAGLYGEGFAVGYVVVDGDGEEQASGYMAAPLPVGCSKEDAAWLDANVIPALYGTTHRDCAEVRNAFWAVWLEWKEKGARLVADCCFPVEISFLTNCVWMNPKERAGQGPYPLLDLSSILLAAGKDPTGTFPRVRGELPAHNPLCDARQSARVLTETLKELGHVGVQGANAVVE